MSPWCNELYALPTNNMCILTMTKKTIRNQHIFLATRKDLGVGGWGLKNPDSVRILNSLEIIGPYPCPESQSYPLNLFFLMINWSSSIGFVKLVAISDQM